MDTSAIVEADGRFLDDLDGRVTAHFEVYTHLKNQILSGALPVGSRIIAADIAQALGVSRMPVREALRQLDSEGLVDMRPNRGALVMKLSTHQLFEIFVIRMTLEGTAARFAAKNRNASSVREIELLLQRMDTARGETRLWLRFHNDLHDQICATSRMPRLVAETRRVRALVDPYLLNFYLELHQSPEMPGHEHLALVGAITEGTPAAAEEAMREHILSAARGIVAHYGGDASGADIFS